MIICLNDILVYRKDLQSQKKCLETILQTLERHQLHAKKSKCKFACNEIEYLGHLISKNGVRTNPNKLESMVNWPIPKTIKALRGFLA